MKLNYKAIIEPDVPTAIGMLAVTDVLLNGEFEEFFYQSAPAAIANKAAFAEAQKNPDLFDDEILGKFVNYLGAYKTFNDPLVGSAPFGREFTLEISNDEKQDLFKAVRDIFRRTYARP